VIDEHEDWQAYHEVLSHTRLSRSRLDRRTGGLGRNRHPPIIEDEIAAQPGDAVALRHFAADGIYQHHGQFFTGYDAFLMLSMIFRPIQGHETSTRHRLAQVVGLMLQWWKCSLLSAAWSRAVGRGLSGDASGRLRTRLLQVVASRAEWKVVAYANVDEARDTSSLTNVISEPVC
jgi:hypothetical protein